MISALEPVISCVGCADPGCTSVLLTNYRFDGTLLGRVERELPQESRCDYRAGADRRFLATYAYTVTGNVVISLSCRDDTCALYAAMESGLWRIARGLYCSHAVDPSLGLVAPRAS
jgi:hypothetical protein